MYVPLCCFHQEGSKSQTPPSDCDYQADPQQTELAESPFFRPRDFLFLIRENLRQQFSTPPHMPIHTCPPHTHSDTPELIRAEVEELKSNFNRRIKEVLFNSLFSAYYVAFLPLCFVKVGTVFVLLSLYNNFVLLLSDIWDNSLSLMLLNPHYSLVFLMWPFRLNNCPLLF